jgi:hypothetical protein
MDDVSDYIDIQNKIIISGPREINIVMEDATYWYNKILNLLQLNLNENEIVYNLLELNDPNNIIKIPNEIKYFDDLKKLTNISSDVNDLKYLLMVGMLYPQFINEINPADNIFNNTEFINKWIYKYEQNNRMNWLFSMLLDWTTITDINSHLVCDLPSFEDNYMINMIIMMIAGIQMNPKVSYNLL